MTTAFAGGLVLGVVLAQANLGGRPATAVSPAEAAAPTPTSPADDAKPLSYGTTPGPAPTRIDLRLVAGAALLLAGLPVLERLTPALTRLGATLVPLKPETVFFAASATLAGAALALLIAACGVKLAFWHEDAPGGREP